jgi:hypothetical protein
VKQRQILALPSWLPLALLLLAAFLLRVIGIDWGVPAPGRLWSFHPDESQVLVAALDLNVFTGKLDNGFYNYGQWYLLATGTLIHILETLKVVAKPLAGIAPTAESLITARIFTAILGTATIWFVFDTARRLGNRAAGFLAGATYAVMPLAVQHAHFATVDVPAAFWVAVTIWAAIAFHATGNSKILAIGAIACGLGAATKYNAGLSLFPLLSAWILRKERKSTELIGALLITGVAFVIGCPGSVLNTGQFIKDILFEARHVGAGSEQIFTNTIPGYLYHPIVNGPWVVAYLWPAIGLGIVNIAIRRKAAELIPLAFALPYFLLIGIAQVKFARYALPLLPVLAIYTGLLFVRKPDQRPYIGAFATLCCAVTLFASITWVRQFMATDPRIAAATGIKASGAEVVTFARRPWFWSASISPQIAHFSPKLAADDARAFDGLPQLVVPPDGAEWSLDALSQLAPGTVLTLSELEIMDAVRLRDAQPILYLDTAHGVLPVTKVYGEPIELPLISSFRQTPYGGWLTLQGVPHDMLYVNPQIWVLSGR